MTTLATADQQGFIAAIKSALSKYGTIIGRASRSEFWYFTLSTLLVSILAHFVDVYLDTFFTRTINGVEEPVFGYTESLWGLLILIPCITVSIRRLHDTNKSGWWSLVAAIPLAGIILFYWWCKASDRGENRFGLEPTYFA